MKQSKVVNVQGNGSWQGTYGTMYQFEYTLENGDIGLANHKKNEPRFNIGENVNYQITKDKQDNNAISFITADQPNSYSNNYNNNKKQSQGSFALSYAKDLAVADKISVDNILNKAAEFNNWLKNN